MDVDIETSSGKRFKIEIWFFDTVLEIKKKIEKYEGYPVSTQTLLFNDQVLANEGNTKQYEILEGSRLQLMLKSDTGKHIVRVEEAQVEMMKLFVTSMSGANKIQVEVHPSDNVGELRNKLLRLQFPLPKENFFICQQNIMEECHSFMWHNVQPGETIEIFQGTVV